MNGRAVIEHGDTFYAEVEFSNRQRAEALLGYGNWSKEGSNHIEDQLPLASRKEPRPVWRSRKNIEANLESHKIWKWPGGTPFQPLTACQIRDFFAPPRRIAKEQFPVPPTIPLWGELQR